MCDKSLFFKHDCGKNITLIALPSDKGCTFEGKTYELQGVTTGIGSFNCNRQADETWIPLKADDYLNKACPFEDLCKDYASEASIFNGTDHVTPTATTTSGDQPKPSSSPEATPNPSSSSSSQSKGTSDSPIDLTKSTLIKFGVFGLILSSLFL